MSWTSIDEKARVIAEEQRIGGNTKGRIADVIRDINDSKVETTDFNSISDDLYRTTTSLQLNKVEKTLFNNTISAQAEWINRTGLESKAYTDAKYQLSIEHTNRLELTVNERIDYLDRTKLDKPKRIGKVMQYVLAWDQAEDEAYKAPIGDFITNIYNVDGTISKNRTVTMAGRTLNFTGGNVGISEPNPQSRLHVDGAVTAGTYAFPETEAPNLPRGLRATATEVIYMNAGGVEKALQFKRPYRAYTCNMNFHQFDSSPQFTVFEAEFGSILWTMEQVGRYRGTLISGNAKFVEAKTFRQIVQNVPKVLGDKYEVVFTILNEKELLVQFWKENGRPGDMYGTPTGEVGTLEVKLYD